MFTLTGTLKDHAGKPVADSAVVITPSPLVTKDSAGNVVYLGGTTVYTDATGKFTATLVANKDVLTYSVRSYLGGPLEKPIYFRSPADTVVVDLADVVEVEPPTPSGGGTSTGSIEGSKVLATGVVDGWVLTADGFGKAQWEVLPTGSAAVSSVNGFTGTVVLDADDVGASPLGHTHDTRYYTQAEVDSMLSGVSSLNSYVNQVETLSDYPASFPPDAHQHAQDDVTGLVEALADRVTTGTVVSIDYATSLPPAGQPGRFIIIVPGG